MRPQIFTGAGQLPTFSKIKPGSFQRSTGIAVRKTKQLVFKTRHLISATLTLSRRIRGRYVSHLVFLGAASLIVVTGNLGFGNLAMGASGKGGTPIQADEPSALLAAATLASQTDILVASDVQKAANDASTQTTLATASDDYLTKHAPIATAGTASRDVTTYTVQAGDTLSGIGSRFNITTDTIKWANSLDDADIVKPGQTLVILPITGVLYTIGAGDTLDSVAAKYKASSALIESYNNLEGKALTAGLKVIVPDGVIEDAPKPVVQTAVATAAPSVIPAIRAFGGGSFANGYAYGYCTWYVATRRSIPGSWGNAINWYYFAPSYGYSTGSVPAVGAIAWTAAGYYGHVAYVEAVSGNEVYISEMNYGGNWGRVTTRWVSASAFRYIY